MAEIKITIDSGIFNGMPITFRAPCDCSSVTGLALTYQHSWWAEQGQWWMETKTFSFSDAHGNILTGVNNLFAKDAVVKVVLDTETNKAFVQNADTNAYLEGRLRYMDDETWKAYNASQRAEAGVYELNEKMGDIDAALDAIIAIQNSYIGGGGE